MKTKRTRAALFGSGALLCAAALIYFGWRGAVQPPSAETENAQSGETALYDGTNADKNPRVSKEKTIEIVIEQAMEIAKEALKEAEKYGSREAMERDVRDYHRRYAMKFYDAYYEKYGQPPLLSEIKLTGDISYTKPRKIVDLSRLGYYKGPQTVEAVMAEFDEGYWRTDELDEQYPREEWIQFALDSGVRFLDSHDYSSIVGLRSYAARIRSKPERYAKLIQRKGLDSEENFNAYIAKEMRWRAKDNEMWREAQRQDPTNTGSIRLPDRYIPTQSNQVHLKITPGDPSHGVVQYGPRERKLTEREKRNLYYHGIAPKGIEVIYLDESNNPLPAGSEPITLKWGDKVSAMSDAQREAALHKAADFLGSDRADEMTALEWKTLADYTGALLDYKPPAPKNAAPLSTPKMPAAPNNPVSPAAPAERTDPAPSSECPGSAF